MDYRTIIKDKNSNKIVFNGFSLKQSHIDTLREYILHIRDAQLEANLLIGNCQMYSLLIYWDLLAFGKRPKHMKGIIHSNIEKRKIVHFWVEVNDDVVGHDMINGVYKISKEAFYREGDIQVSTEVSIKEHQMLLCNVFEIYWLLQEGKFTIADMYKSNNNEYLPNVLEHVRLMSTTK